MATIWGILIGFAVLAAVFWPLERLCPALARQPLWHRGSLTDLTYWFFTPLVTRAITRGAVIASVIALASAAGVPLDREHVQAFIAHPAPAVGNQPAWLQVIEVFLLGDLIGYWSHRLFHGRQLWPFHAVHHSSTQVDWLSAVRLHPVNDVLSRLIQVVPILVVGFSPALVAAYVPFLTFHAILLHANVAWTFGPLRYAISSPAFHRWHHTTEAEGQNKNFAGLFPFIDLLFGTFYMPRGRQPMHFGISGSPVPDGLWAQLRYPFR